MTAVAAITGLVPVRLRAVAALDSVRALRVIVLPAPPFKAAIVTLPVFVSPRVKFCLLVVPKTPRPVRYVALFPEFAEILAVGVPPATLRNANFALAVAVEPKSTSRVLLYGESALELSCQ